jgi:hypothetical protein
MDKRRPQFATTLTPEAYTALQQMSSFKGEPMRRVASALILDRYNDKPAVERQEPCTAEGNFD